MRPTVDEYYLNMAELAATRSTCARRQVGCVLVDVNNRVMATGHNGVASGVKHCTDFPCPGADSASTTDLGLCQAIHAEQNALMYCPDPFKIKTCYVTTSPCVHCIKMLLNTSCQELVFREIYDPEAIEIWTNARGGNTQKLVA